MRAVRNRAGVALATLAALVVSSGCTWNAELVPPIADRAAQSSKIFAADGTLVTTLHAEENRESVRLAQMPDHLVDAVVAIEDERFWAHRGVDLRAILRAAYTDAAAGRVEEGGSTITQQYVKNALLGPEQTIHRKIREAALAYKLEQRYPKRLILERYLNTIYFGNGAYGVQAAATTYFGVDAADLTLAQAALVAGVIRAPTDYDPYDHPEAARARRDLVLAKVGRLGWAPAADVAAARATPLGILDEPAQAQYPAPYFIERVKQFVLDDPAFGDTPAERQAVLFGGGLRIQTTLDLKAQTAAEAAVASVLAQPGGPLAAVVAIEPSTGAVRAVVGGRDFFGGGAQAKFDLATQGARHAGSAFKPFVLAQALAGGVPLTKVYPAPAALDITLPNEVWHVDNYGEGGYGALNLVDATTKSANTVYAQLIMEIGPEKAVTLARAMGVGGGDGAHRGRQEPRPAPPALAAYPSAVLGTNDVTPLDMTKGYATLANHGIAVDPVFVTRVTKADGTVLFDHVHRQRRVLPQAVADTVTAVLRQNIEAGTGTKAQIGRPAAGKTGTAQEWRNAWFCGYTPDLATAVWLGYDPEQLPMTPPRVPIRVTGGSYPAEIWGRFMAAALDGTPPTDFTPPPPETTPPPAADQAPPSSVPPGAVGVPNVVGMPVDRAVAALRAAGFSVERRSVTTAAYAPGYVVAQSPRPRTLVAPGSVVTVDVSAGGAPGIPPPAAPDPGGGSSGPAPTSPPPTSPPDTVATAEVPDVRSQNRDQAARTLADAGLALDAQTSDPGRNRKVDPGTAWRQDPSAGSKVPRGSTVTVWFAPG